MSGLASLFTGPLPLQGVVALLAFFGFAWLASVVKRDASVVDAFWGPAFVVLVLAYRAGAAAPEPRADLVLAMVALWAVRLAAHILARSQGRGEDPRYAAMRARSPRTFTWTSLVTVFALQAVVAWLVGLPLLAAHRAGAAPPGAIEWAGVALWAGGLAIEAIADAQLARFRADRANEGGVMDRGLWAWSRHPNYFGEACLWWGIGLVAVRAPGGTWALAGPALVTLLLLRVSGVTLLERHLASSRPGYANYVARTSAFVPWPPRRA